MCNNWTQENPQTQTIILTETILDSYNDNGIMMQVHPLLINFWTTLEQINLQISKINKQNNQKMDYEVSMNKITLQKILDIIMF